MKIRNGFVSNSSSSSFVVLLPKDFSTQIDNIDFSEWETGEDDTISSEYGDHITKKAVRAKLHELVRDKSLWMDDCSEEYEIIQEIMEKQDLIIAVVEGGPDEGTITVADIDKVQGILSKVS